MLRHQILLTYNSFSNNFWFLRCHLPPGLVRANFHFSCRLGGDGGLSGPSFEPVESICCFSFSSIIPCSSKRYPPRESLCGVSFLLCIACAFFLFSCWNNNVYKWLTSLHIFNIWSANKEIYLPRGIQSTLNKWFPCLLVYAIHLTRRLFFVFPKYIEAWQHRLECSPFCSYWRYYPPPYEIRIVQVIVFLHNNIGYY